MVVVRCRNSYRTEVNAARNEPRGPQLRTELGAIRRSTRKRAAAGRPGARRGVTTAETANRLPRQVVSKTSFDVSGRRPHSNESNFLLCRLPR